MTKDKKISTLYIDDFFYKILGIDLKTLRVRKRITIKELSKSLNISTNSIRSLEKGELKKAYNFIHIYCRHFSENPNLLIKKYNLQCTTFIDKLEYLKLYFGVKNLKELDIIINSPYSGSIYDYISKGIPSKIEMLVINKFEELKKK